MEHCYPTGVWPGTMLSLQAASVYQDIPSWVTALVSKAVTSGAVTGGDMKGLARTVTVTSSSKGALSKGDSVERAGDRHHLPSTPVGCPRAPSAQDSSETAVPAQQGHRCVPGPDKAAPLGPEQPGAPGAQEGLNPHRARKGRNSSFGICSALCSLSSLEFLHFFPSSAAR